ncbi:MAG: arginine--tRNA ligase [Nanoarchaeota archaeon]
MKQVVVNLLQKALEELGVKLKKEEIEKVIETPPSSDMGDYAFPCFFLASKLKSEPQQIALELRAKIKKFPMTDFDDIQTSGAYVNFILDRKNMARKIVWEAITQKKNFGKSKIGAGRRTMVEFPSPNTNKPLHLGHLRNMSIGESISKLLEFNGVKVIRANLYNDRGTHICKSMLAYQKWGRDKTPASKKIKSDHFVGDFYVMFNKNLKKNKKLEDDAQAMLMKWEEGDKRVLLLWKLMTNWAINGFNETYKKFGIKHDVTFFESKLYEKGRTLVEEGLKNKLFVKSKKGDVKINLEGEGLGEKILLRSDGTSLYIVQDLALAKIKFEKYKLNESYYVVGSEHDYHFKTLFSILDKLGFKNKGLKHLSYGMVNLPEGKMKGREGTVVDADDLIEKVQELVKKELISRAKLSKRELEKRSLVISLAAIKYFLLKIDIKKDMLFNPKASINFEGDTGPYILYSYARASSILRKAGVQGKFNIGEMEPKELELVKKLSQFPDVVLRAYNSLNPSLIANYSFQLAKLFNEFYHACPVIGSENESFRLALVEAFRRVLGNSLNLLGIETLEEM